MIAITADPTRELTLYFRINRDGSLIFSFLDLNGLPLNLSPYTFVINFKYRKGDSTNFLQIIPTISDNNAILTLTKVQTAIFREQIFFWELVRTKAGLDKNWLTGDAIFHQGKFDGITNSGEIFINSFDDMVQITVNETAGFAGTVIYKGIWDASGNTLPSSLVYKGYQYLINPGGNIPSGGGSVDIAAGTMAEALIDSPGQIISNWKFY